MALAKSLLNGEWYVNIPSDQYPGGEIRGQILPINPVNDFFIFSLEKNQSHWEQIARMNEATREPGEPSHFRNSTLVSVWFKWTPYVAGNSTVWSKGTNFQSGILIYTGGSITNLRVLAASNGVKNPSTNEIKAVFNAEKGVNYFIALVAPTNSSGNYQIGLDQPSAPFVVQDPSPVQARAIDEHPVTFAAHVEGSPLLAIQWERSAEGTNWVAIPGARGPSWTIERTRAADAGFYRVRATNSLGVVVSRPAELKHVAIVTQPLSGLRKEAGRFQFQVNEIEGYRYIVEGTSSLISPILWTALETNRAPFVFAETNSAQERFYRTRLE